MGNGIDHKELYMPRVIELTHAGKPWDITDWTLSEIAAWDAAAKRAEPGAQWVKDFEAGKEQV